jgi:hypothetical protein
MPEAHLDRAGGHLLVGPGQIRKRGLIVSSVIRPADVRACNSGWTSQVGQSVSAILPSLIHGQRAQITPSDQRNLAIWSGGATICRDDEVPTTNFR